ncbi:hypothetical protein TIFTF001_004773 [Ficus carica]|uniref:Uncharacterized protein n=1 Tax=Ficus carica TaxID=3494 RepID=A0AA88A5K8_FICCA|nr:hypothetical protein TIFTF001_004773 [Ficus carica]
MSQPLDCETSTDHCGISIARNNAVTVSGTADCYSFVYLPNKIASSTQHFRVTFTIAVIGISLPSPPPSSPSLPAKSNSPPPPDSSPPNSQTLSPSTDLQPLPLDPPLSNHLSVLLLRAIPKNLRRHQALFLLLQALNPVIDERFPFSSDLHERCDCKLCGVEGSEAAKLRSWVGCMRRGSGRLRGMVGL